MTQYFHAARLPDRLQVGQTISAQKWSSESDGYTEILATLLPAGLGKHGINYVDRSASGPSADSLGALEMLAEFIRQIHYPHRPSRLTSFFVWRTLEAARDFARRFPATTPEGLIDPRHEILIIESDQAAFDADMQWLNLGQIWGHALIHLYYYWSGQHTDNPMIETLLPLPVRIVGRVA